MALSQLKTQTGGEGGLHLDAIWIRANTQGPLKEMLESKSNPAPNHHQALEANECLNV